MSIKLNIVIKYIVNIFLLFILVVLSGCATFSNGSTQKITIKTRPVSKASCVISNHAGKWFIPSTPDYIRVSRSFSDLNIECHAANGFIGKLRINPLSPSVHYQPCGGPGDLSCPFKIISSIVDTVSGSVYSYDSKVTVNMHKKGTVAVDEL